MPRIRVQRCSRSATPAWICVRCRTPAPLRGLARKPYLLRAETLSLAQRYAAGWRPGTPMIFVFFPYDSPQQRNR